MDGILTCNSATSAVPQQAQRVRRKAALSARVIVSAAARGEPMIIPDDLTSSRGSHCSGYQSSMQDKKKSATTTAAVVASASTYMAAASVSVTLASIDHKPPLSDSIVSILLLPAAASHSLSRPTINATALSASSLTSIGFSSSGSDSGSDYSSSGVSSNNTFSSSSSSASSSSNNKKKTALSAHAVQYLKNWMMSPEHVDHPYPTEDEKVLIMNETGIVLKQLTNWFVNNRKRYWKPKVEELRRRQEGDIAGDGGEETRTIEMEFTGGCAGDGNNRNVLSLSPVEQGSNTNNKRQLSTRNTKKRSSNNDDDDGLLPTAKKTRNSNSSSSSITDGTMIITPTPTITMLLPPATAPSYLPSFRDDMKLNMTRVNGTNRSGTSVVSDESGSGRGSGTEEESGDDIDDDIQHHVSNPLFDKSSYSSLDVMESSSSSDIELRTTSQQVMNMIDMDYSFNPLNMEDTITTNDHHQQHQEEEEHICCSILPHSCTDPKSHSIQPCALCSACRDWNLGEFCPWDLTGILGDLSTDYTMLQEAEGSESMTMVKTSTTAGVANDVIPIFSDEDGSSTHNCETISPTLTLSSTNIDDTTTIPIEPTMMSTTMYSNLSVPQEISHSTSAMNFMADIESWD